MRRIVSNTLRVASLLVGVGLGHWMAQPNYNCPTPLFANQLEGGLCPPLFPEARFAWWLRVLCGAAAAAAILVIAVAVGVPHRTSNRIRPVQGIQALPLNGWVGSAPKPVGGWAAALHYGESLRFLITSRAAFTSLACRCAFEPDGSTMPTRK